MLPLIFSDCQFHIPQNLFGEVADRCSKGIYSGRGVEIEDIAEILIFKKIFRINAAPGHKAVRDTGGEGVPEGHTKVKFLVVLQKAALGAVADLAGVIIIILCGKL